MKLIKFGLIICGLLLYGLAKAQDYTVTFVDRLDTVRINVEHGSPITALSPEPARDGFNFGGWFIDNGTFEEKWDFETYVVTQDTTLYAKWEKAIPPPVYHTVTFVDRLDTVRINVEHGSPITALSPEPARSGYDFGGWFIDDDTFEEKWDFDTDVVMQDITLHARWICAFAKVQIARKPNSNILICEANEKTCSDYSWGYHEKNKPKYTNKVTRIESVMINNELKTDSTYIHCQYIEFPKSIGITTDYEYFVEITCGNSCPTRSYYIHPPDLRSTLITSKISVYPNPTKQHLSVTLEKDIKDSFTVLLLNPFGQTVFSKQYTEYRNNEVLSVDFNLPTGMYILAVKTKEEVLTAKILIK